MATATYETSEHVSGPGGRGKVSKVAKYGWILRDRPGEFAYINKNELHIDHAYQRDKVIVTKIREIQANWSWAGCGCILVARRRDGSCWVFDGQHRVLAARNRSDIADLPCLVFDVDDKTQEAAGFLVSNSERKPVSAIAKFKAMVLTNDPASVSVDRVFKDLGIEYSDCPNGPGQIKCIASCIRLAAADVEAFRVCLAAAAIVCGDEPIHSDILEGLFWIERRHQIVSTGRFMRRLESIPKADLLQSITRFAAAEGKRGEKVSAAGILKCVNKGLRSKFGEDDQA